MLTFQLMSDCHLEFHADEGREFVRRLDPSITDVAVIAGDFATTKMLVKRLTEMCQKFRHVIFVAGNHEFYMTTRENVYGKLSSIARRFPNFHWLNCSSVVVDGQRITGCTMWFPPTLQTTLYRDQLSDYRVIQGFSKWIGKVNSDHVAFLYREVHEGDVVATHHLPTFRSVHERYRGDPLNCFYVCDQTHLIAERSPKIWCWGHSHQPMDFQLFDTRMVSNPHGYVGHESIDWHPVIVEV